MISLLLNYILLGWIFWPIFALAAFFPHPMVKDERRFEGWAFLPILIALGAAWWRWTSVFPTTAAGWGWLGAAYLAAGFLVSLGGYLDMLKRAKAVILTVTRRAPEDWKSVRLFSGCVPFEWRSRLVYVPDTEIKFDWTTLPLANWWVYWPYFLLDFVFSFVTDLGNRLVAGFKGLYDKLASMWSVKL